jgi:hypothetical protein
LPFIFRSGERDQAILGAYAQMLANVLKLMLTVSQSPAGSVAPAAETAPPQCYSTAQTREQIALNKLVGPFPSMLAISRAVQGDPIGVRLCRINAELVYEINLLRRDGHILKILVDATTGKPHSSRQEN